MMTNQVFKTVLDGQEFFLKDHRVFGEAVLPGAAYLEMARAAAVASDCPRVIGLKNVVWLAPLAVAGSPREIRIEIAAKGEKTLYLVRGAQPEAPVHGQGEIVVAEASAEAPHVDPRALAARCSASWTGDELYAFFGRQGLHYGESFRCIQELHRSESEVLAQYRLAPELRADAEPFALHPGVVDGALQSTIGLLLSDLHAPVGSVHLPFSLKELTIYDRTPVAGYVRARWSAGSSARSDVLKFDIDILDESGVVCVSIKEFASRRYEKAPVSEPLYGTMIWSRAPLGHAANGKPAPAPSWGDALVVLAEASDATAAAISAKAGVVRLESAFDARGIPRETGIVDTVHQSLRILQGLLKERPKGRRDVVFLVAVRGDGHVHAPLAGVIKALRQEHRDIRGKLVFVPAELSPENALRLLQDELTTFDDVEVRYDPNGQREVRRFIESELPTAEGTAATIEPGGVYWITGGLGGLGKIFAKRIAETRDVTIVLTGRSALSSENRAWMASLRDGGASVDYLACDVSDARELEDVLAEIKDRYGKVNGIIHSAGVVRDGYIVNKDAADTDVVFGAKVLGLLAIDAATQGEPLDFVILFSSVSAVWGNAGQADYAAANAFLDAFAAHRNELVKAGKRSGRTLSINWPLWRAGGMKVDAHSEKLAERAYGFTPLEEEAGWRAFERALRTSLGQVVVLSGHADRIRSQVIGAGAPQPAQRTEKEVRKPAAGPRLDERVERILVDGVSTILKISESDIELDIELSAYGFDSISLTALSNQLSSELGVELLPTLFYEHGSLGSIKEFLLSDHREALERKLGAQEAAAEPPPVRKAASHEIAAAPVPVRVASEAGVARPSVDGVAVVGISGRFPKARDLEAFWSNLAGGVDCIEVIPEDRWDWRAIFGDPHTEGNRTNVKWGGFIDEVALFDPQFFGISPKEAELMDPQQRLLMEHVWWAMEDAGYSAKALSGTKTGMFLAIGPGSYRQPATQPMEAYSATGAVPSMAPNRMSFFLNLRGPSEPVETACSSSLVALHRAVQAIVAGYCDQAFVGAVNLIISPELHICFSKAGMLSEDGRCKTFSRLANGYVRGEGVGAMLVKSLRRAQADHDGIYGIVRATSVNHGGRATSLTAPNGSAQTDLLLDVYRRANIDVRTVTYIETHGTGTPLGDPIEINALKKAFDGLYADRGLTVSQAHCGLGSVKTNVGHLEVAAGMAGLFKVLLAMKHRELPKTLHCEEANPYIELENSPFYLVREKRAWSRPVLEDGSTAPLRAGISSFGFGGANAHVVLEEYLSEPVTPAALAEDAIRIVPLSARDEVRLSAYAAKLLQFVLDATGSASEPASREAREAGEKLREELVVLVARTLATEPGQVDPAESFDEYGVDLGLLANEVHRAFSVGVVARDLRQADSIDGLVRHLLAKTFPESNTPSTARAGDNASFLTDLAFTLQVGREPMDCRVAFAARNVDELTQKLRRFVSGDAGADVCATGHARKDKDSVRLLNSDDAGKELVSTWLQSGKLVALSELWAKGLDVDWNRLYPAETPRRIRVPTYPFARERHWLASAQVRDVPAVVPAPVEALGELAEYEEFWEREEGSDVRDGELPKRWLVVTDDGALGASLEKAHGIEVICGTSLEGLPKGAAYGVVYGAGQGLERQRGIHGLLRAARTAGVELRRLVLLGDIRNSYDATLIGIERSLGLVEPQLKVSAVYGDGELPSAEQVSRELNGRGVVRYAQGARYRLSYREAPAAEGTTPLREQGAYLITGGSGGLGSLFAEHLAKEYRARLALVGRRDLDEAIERQLESLRARGATEAVYYRADVGNASEVDVLISKVEGSWGSLQGIVHAAGLEARGTVYEKEWAGYAETLRSKVEGTRHLDERTSKHELDFVSYFSSTAAVLGDGGSCDYASGNRYQMAYAHQREELRSRGERSGKTVAVCWPLWRAGGMSDIGSESVEAYLHSSGQRYLEKDEGIRAWERALRSPGPVRVVLAAQRSRAQEFLSRIYAAPSRSAVAAVVALPEQVVRDLKTHIETVLKLPADRLSDDVNFADMGLDSIGLAQLARLLTTRYGFEVVPNVFFNHSTIEKFAAHLIERHRADLERAYRSIPETPAAPRREEAPSPRREEAPPPRVLSPAAEHDPVAIIGMSARVARADDIEQLWEGVLEGRKYVEEIPAERWDWRPYYRGPGAADNRIATNKGAFVPGLDQFDPLFFEIPPREAQWMDPRQRLILQEAWRAFEDAGYAGERLRGTECAVFIGVEEAPPQEVDAQRLVTSQHNGILAARISYVLDLRGPNLAINTACSSGLVAVHDACQAIQRGDCSMALAGGVNVLTSPLIYVALSQSGMLSTDGECYAFDRRANGMVPGEAVAAVILKSLSRAVADGDPIYGVIKASGVNYDGKTNGISAPNSVSQQRLIERVLERAGVGAERIQYVLGHSVGSSLGDPIEVEALSEAFRARGATRPSCALGSIKPLIGHTFAASGVVSLITMCLALKHRRIVGTSNYQQPNEYIDFAKSPFYIADAARPWDVENAAQPRCGLVGATGMSGTNAFVLVEESPAAAAEPPRPSDEAFLFVLSAKTDAVLLQYARNLTAYLTKHPAIDPARVAYTLQTGREAMPRRLAVVASSAGALIEKLNAYLEQPAPQALLEATHDERLASVARAWVAGAKLHVLALHSNRPPTRLAGLPTYPFAKRSLLHPEQTVTEIAPPPGNKAAEYYTFDAQHRSDEYKEEYLTFCPFERQIPGFSMTRVLSAPAAFPDEYRMVLEKQIEMRQVLFRNEDFRRVHRALDIGCGCATDLIQLAKRGDHISAEGFTITKAQAELGNRRIRNLGLSDRVKVHHADSSKDRFPGIYDLIIGFEVTCHIANKTSLFQNIARALAPQGSVLLMDFVANLRGSIVDSSIDIAISTQKEWIDVLTANELLLEDFVDLSLEVANYVIDPELEKNIADFPEAAKLSSRNFANMAVSLRENWISYCLFKLKKATGRSTEEIRAHNAAKLSQKTPYARAVVEMKGALPRPPAPVPAPAPISASGDLTSRLEKIFQDTLQLTPEELRSASSFTAMGIGSLMAVRLLEAINTAFDLHEPTSVMFQFHDLPSLARHLAPKLPAVAPPVVATLAIVESTSREPERSQRDGLAIVGVSCRCAGAANQSEFWDLVLNGKECIERIESRHPEWKDFFASHSVDASAFRAGIMPDSDCFDSLFFDISPMEAEQMDRAQRVLLEEIHNALEDAGYDPKGLKERRVGTFVGSMGMASPDSLSHLAMLGSDGAILSSRIAYYLNLSGPAMTVNTACSSSLVAIELACEKLRNGDIDMAIAGGITIYSHPGQFLMMHNAGMLSPAGRCLPFDDRADGIVVGDGVGVVVLTTLSRAVREGAHIYGIVRAIGTNQDGKTSGITAPSFLSQSRLEQEVYEKARISPAQLQYVEAHGTGTKLGDPVEVHALTQAFTSSTNRRQFCALGSLKANIGHTTAASGVLGLVKVLLSMKHGRIPPAAHFARPNRHIDFDRSPFFVSTEPAPWAANAEGTRIAAVSSFGFSGTNAHLVVEDYVSNAPSHRDVGEQLVVLSARKPERLVEYARRLLAFVQRHDVPLADLAWTLQTGRTAMEHRLAIVVRDLEELRSKLSAYVAGRANIDGCFSARAIARDDHAQPAATASQLAAFWVSGGTVDWEARTTPFRQRISLPTYPFERVRMGRPAPTDPTPTGRRRSGLLVKSWASSHEPAAQAADVASHRFAILATARVRPLAEALRRHLPYAEILLPEHLHAAAATYAGCIDLSALDPSHGESDFSWFAWLQTLVEQAPANSEYPLVLLQVTSRLERFGNERVQLAGAGRTGLYRMLRCEYGKVASRHLDTDVAPGDVETLCAQILNELHAPGGISEVAYREGVRHEPAMTWWNGDAAAADGALSYPSDEVLWITGGTRGIGMLCAKHFVEHHGVRKLVLLGQKLLPPRSQWNAVLASGSDPVLSRKIEDVRYLESQGAQVRVIATALTDREGLRYELERVRNEMGEVFGVIHGAGCMDFGNPAFIRKTREVVEKVTQPKMAGVDALRAVFEGAQLRFVLLFSSISAILGKLSVGQSDYAMANAYLDYVAASGFGPGVEHCVSIQWPSWKETGMGAADSDSYRKSGLATCTDREGLGFLDEILARKVGPVVMPLVVDETVFDLRTLLQPAPGRAPRALPAAAPRAPVAAAQAPVSAKPSANIEAAVTDVLTRLVSQELKVASSDIETERSFDEYGVDSVMLAQMVQKMDLALPGIKIDPTAVLENPSIARLARHLVQTRQRALESIFARPAPVAPVAVSAPARPVAQVVAEKVAVVGMACHFPGAPDIRQFWQNLCEGRDSIREVPSTRWDVARHYGAADDGQVKSVSKWGGFLDDIDMFDPVYFGIPEAVATGVDPLARQWLEVSAEALADAGYTKADVRGQKVGVFCGSRSSNYSSKHRHLDSKAVIGVGQNFISAHLSHSYDFSGPNVIVDTACASSLTAVHMAVQSIRQGDSTMAVAGGVDILLDEGPFVLLSSAKILSSDGRCRTFDESANGIGIGEGCGVLILKALSAALRDGNKVYGVIDGSAINCDGNTMGITTPNPKRQQELIEQAVSNAGIGVETIGYIEAHGTGTLIGDPIELRSLSNVLGKTVQRPHSCGVGSVKSNFGHLLSAAGAAGLIKVLLSIVHGQLAPTLHCDRPNPRFDFESSPLYPVHRLESWAGVNGVHRAGVSAFGLGGHNAHIIVSDEGVPASHRATTVPRGEPVLYRRKRYWAGEPQARQERQEQPENKSMQKYFAIQGAPRMVESANSRNAT